MYILKQVIGRRAIELRLLSMGKIYPLAEARSRKGTPKKPINSSAHLNGMLNVRVIQSLRRSVLQWVQYITP